MTTATTEASRTGSQVAAWMVETGRPFANAHEIGAEIGCDPSQVAARLQRPRERGEVINVAPGGWVVGGMHSDPDDFLDDWMQHLGISYHVAFGSASYAYVGSYQVLNRRVVVAVERPLKSRRLEVAGGTSGLRGPNIQFVHRHDFHRYPTVTMTRRSGYRGGRPKLLQVTTPEATVLDCVLRPEHAGGWFGVENILARWLEWLDLSDFPGAPQLNAEQLAATAELYPRRVCQQTGHLLSSLLQVAQLQHIAFDLQPLRSTLPSHLPVVTCGPLDGDGPLVNDQHWGVVRDYALEPDL